jgi:hypothetical protein
MAIFALLVVKILIEAIIDAPIFAQPSSVAFRVLPSAHIIGVAAAAAALLSERWKMPKCRYVRIYDDRQEG